MAPTSSWLAAGLAIAPIAGALAQSQPFQYGFSNLRKRNATARSWADAAVLADDFVSQLNITEKAAMLTGNMLGPCDGQINPIDRLNFTGICLHDGPLGVRVADLVTLFPAGITVGASWDKDLMYTRGYALGEEFKGKGANVVLGPVAGPLGRNPLGGREWEGFGSDPYLSGVAMDSTIRGQQDAGVQSCAKHFIGNEQETQRTDTEIDGVDVPAVSANIDDRTLHELYLWPFANSIKAGVASIMCSYNRLNLTYSCENDAALNGIVKGELDFQGYVVSDWFATHSGVDSILAGLDLNMPGPTDATTAELILSLPYEEIPSYFGSNLIDAVDNGSIPESRVDDMIRRVMTPYYLLGQDEDYPEVDPTTTWLYYLDYDEPIDISIAPPAVDVRGDHATVAREVAAAGTVLLKNEGSILPLGSITNIAIFGNDAPDTTDGLYFEGSETSTDRPLGAEYGTLAVGGGSGSGRTSDLISPLRAIRDRGIKDGFRTQYITNNDMVAAGTLNSIFPEPDVCLVFLKTYAVEGWDRLSFENDWNSTYVVNNVASLCVNKTVVITHSAGVNTLPWADSVSGIIAAHYPGEQSGNAIVDVLWGDVNPSGHLPYTIPQQESDYPFRVLNLTGSNATDGNAWQVNFTEGLLTDYRHFDTYNITPLYEFGFGLSYTTFDLDSTLTVNQALGNVSALVHNATAVAPGGNPELWDTLVNVTATVSNTGSVAGAAVPQLYVSLPSGCAGGPPIVTPVRVLRGFEKVQLQPGASTTVTFPLMRRDLSFWSTLEQQWRIPSGSIGLSVGFSSRDLRATASVKLL
ncbi:beta2 tomatinase [Xylariales sp. PMI_506]|nr:beta2 tomatinase [Xylariales sp. PMI_506]